MTFAAIPGWTCDGKAPGILTFFESIALSGLEERPLRLAAADQRKLLGGVVFGRREITVHRNGTVECWGDTGFGRDRDGATWSAQTVRLAAEAGKELHPTSSGRRYYAPPAKPHP